MNKNPPTKILIVDDEPSILQTLGDRLEFNGYKVISAKNGFEAIKLAKTSMPDVIVTDIRMPIMNGMEMITILRNDMTIKHIPVIIMSVAAGRYWPPDLNGKFDACLTKPFELSDLLGIIEKLVQGSRCAGC